jgi:DNA-binding transcriptional MerR regulator
MFRIGEFSKLGQVSSRMLRHYDQLGLLKPGQTDHWTGYRYYTIGQLTRLHRIVALKEMGLSLEQIGDLLAHDESVNPERLRGMLMLAQANLERELREGQDRLRRVETRLRQIEQEGQPSPYEVAVKAVPAQTIASIRQLAPTIGEVGYYCETLYARLYAGLQSQGIIPLQPEITLYHNDEYTETDIDVEIAVPVQPKHLKSGRVDEVITFRELPAHNLAAALIYEGPFQDLPDGILALLKWVGLSGYTIIGPLCELHLSGPAHQNEAETIPVVELQVPITPLKP